MSAAIDVPWTAQVVRRETRARRIDLNVAEGTIFSLLGPNGAGKTTAVQILSTLITADAGEIRVAGHDLHADPRRSGPRSASPASSPRSTACSPAGRT
jgi:ABC-2 type transport system ATP-binding protein